MLFIKKIHILVLKSFFILFIPSFFVTIFVLMLQFIWLYADDLVGKGLDFVVLMKMLYYIGLVNVNLALPIAVMLASIMTFGGMGEHYELTAAKSAGISLYRIMAPIFVLAVILTFLSFLFANNVFPYASLKTYSLVSSIRQQHPTLRIQEGMFNSEVDGYVIRIGAKSKTTQMMYDFMIYDHVNYQGNKFVIVADSGIVSVTDNMKFMLITLFHGTQYEELKEDETTKVENRQYPYHLDIFEKQVMIIPLKGFDFKENDASLFRQNYNMLNVSQLRDKIDSLNEKYLSKIDYYFRILMNNDLLKNQIKFRTNTDSVNYLSQIEELNKVNSKNLTVFYNIDSAFVNQTIHNQKEVLKISQNNAENLLNRLVVFNAEFTSRRSWLIEHQVAMHKKYVLAVACFIFFFIGAPLGSIIRKGGIGLPTIISVLLFIIFYVILTFGEKLARDGHLTALIGIWLAVIIYFPFVFYLFYVASTDSVLFNFDTYKDFFDKIKQKLTIRIKFRIKYLAKKNKNKNKINDEQR